MASSENRLPEDALLIQYLLGRLPGNETERLDELSVKDEEFAWRLNAVENDLVDAYARDELSPEDEKHFKAAYLSSSRGKEKVQFARGLLELERKAARANAGVPDVVASLKRPQQSARESRWRLFPRFAFPWGLAGASLALLVIGGFLLLQNAQLRRQLSQVQAEHAVLDQHAQSLQKQLEEETATLNEKPKEQENARPSLRNLDQLKTVSVLLPPPTRGVSKLTALAVHPGTDLVVVVLGLEADDFPAYRAKLRDPATNRTLWQSSKLTASTGSQAAVSVTFSASLLKQQTYIIELVGIPSHGGAEVVGGYPFRVVLQ